MIALRMLQALVTGTLVVLAGAAVARTLARAGRPARFAWAVTLLLALLVPAVRMVRDRHVPTADAAGVVGVEGVGALVRLPPLVVRSEPALAALDRPLLALWAASSALTLVWLAGGALWLARQRRRWRPATVDGAPVRLAPSTGPAVVGWRRATVVLPPWALALPTPARALLLAHERAHVAARDPLLLVAATLAVAVAPWHPALWWTLAQLRAAVELDCDGRVLRTAATTPAQRRAYAALLLEVGERLLAAPRLPPGAVAFGHAPSLLARRIEAMTMPRPRHPALRLAGAVGAGAALLGAALAFPTARAAAAAQPSMAPRPADQPPAQPQPARDSTGARFFEFRVDQPARVVAAPRFAYPAALQGTGTQGRVTVQFVVGPDGRIRPGTLKVLEGTPPALVQATATALADTAVRFAPARVQGRPVAQLIQLPVTFAPDRVTSGDATPPMP